MALNDICFAETDDHLMEIGAGSWSGSLNDEVWEATMIAEHALIWPIEAEVKLGTDYGPTGVEYTGTYVPAGAGAFRVIGSAVIRRIR